jgi:hypothetical protein
LDPLIKSPSRAVVLKELFSQSFTKRRVKGQHLAVDFPNGIAPAQVQRRIQMDNLMSKAAGAGTNVSASIPLRFCAKSANDDAASVSSQLGDCNS